MGRTGTRLRAHGQVSRAGGPGVATSDKRGFPRTILMPTLKPWLPLEATVASLAEDPNSGLPGGLNVGDYWPCHEGGFRICQAKEALRPGRVTFWAGSEEGRVSAADGTQTILPVKRGAREVYVETTAQFADGEFQEGYLRIMGGLVSVAGRQFTIAYNEASYESTEISGDAERYVTKIVLADPINTALDPDTDWHIQSNVFACQRHAPGDTLDTDQPRLSIGIPRIPIPEGHYFWCQVEGAATGQLRDAIDAADCVSGKVDLIPDDGTAARTDSDLAKVGKLFAVGTAAVVPSQVIARLIVRKETAFAADAFVPIWLYGDTAV